MGYFTAKAISLKIGEIAITAPNVLIAATCLAYSRCDDRTTPMQFQTFTTSLGKNPAW